MRGIQWDIALGWLVVGIFSIWAWGTIGYFTILVFRGLGVI